MTIKHLQFDDSGYLNDGKYYNVTLTAGAVSGASYKYYRSYGTVYRTDSSNTFSDSTAVTWASSSTVTPIYGPITGAIIERECDSSLATPPILTLRSTNGGTVANTGIKFEYGGGATCGQVVVNSSGHMQLTSYNNIFLFGGTLAGYNNILKLAGGVNTSGAYWNPGGASFDITFLGQGSEQLAKVATEYNTFVIGASYSYDPTAVGSATLASLGAGSNLKSDDTFDGYTLQQVVKALRDIGVLA